MRSIEDTFGIIQDIIRKFPGDMEKRIGRDKKLTMLLIPRPEEPPQEIPEELL